MNFISAALTAYGLLSDTIGIAEFIAQRVRKEGQSTEELFTSCFKRAVNRCRLKLAKHTETKDFAAVAIDERVLADAVAKATTQLGQHDQPFNQDNLISFLCPVFRDVLILPGHQLPSTDLDQLIAEIMGDAFTDFFSKLPAHPNAVAQEVVSHIGRVDQAHDQCNTALEHLESMLRQVLAHQEELSRHLPYLDPAVIQQESTRPEYHNPFRIVKAEDFNHDYDRLAALFREPSIYDDLQGPDNLIIAGGRGCGKSMLLRSLSALTAIELRRLKTSRGAGQNPPSFTWRDSGLKYFGVYIKLARGYFYEWSPDCKLKDGAAIHLFQHVFNMILLRALVEALLEARNHNVLRIESYNEQAIVSGIRDAAGFSMSGDSFADLLLHTRTEERHVRDYLGALRLGTGEMAYHGSHTSIHDFMDCCCSIVLKSVPELDDSRIFFLLDEYENLAEFQQRVVNTLAKLRPLSLSLKVAARALGIKSIVDLQGEPIQRPRDYHVVELDYNPADAGYRKLLLDIATKRLEAERFTETNIRRLLPGAPRFHPSSEGEVLKGIEAMLEASGKQLSRLNPDEQKEQLHRWSIAMVFRLSSSRRQPMTYAGFDDFVDLSSGIISSFLEFCKLAFYLAQAEGVDVSSGKSIPWQTQNEAVYTASRAYFEYIERNVPDTGADVSRLLLDLADIFREKLFHHASEPEAARLVIKDPGLLDSAAYRSLADILDDAVRWSVFHATGQASAYFPKHKTEVRSNDYPLNRILAPILRISPRARWRCTFTVKELAGLVDQASRTTARNRLRAKHRGSSSTTVAEEDSSLFSEENGDD